MEVRIMRIQDAEIPIAIPTSQQDPELQQLRERFHKGETLSQEELTKLVQASLLTPTNGNCFAC